jgi:hypothetical protein
MTAAQHWQQVVRQATTEAALLGAIRDYLASLPEDAVARLPESVRPLEVATADDIATLNVMVVRAELMHQGDPESAALLRQMLTVLGEAVGRLASMSLDARLLRPTT